MVSLKVLGRKKFNNNLLFLYKINKGFFEKKICLNFNINKLSKNKIKLISLLKKSNLINFLIIKNKYNILFRKINNFKLKNSYIKIFLKYFENKPIYIF